MARAQQGVQVRQLAALALVAHPDAVMRVPPARTMQQEERVIAARRVLPVQRFDPLGRQGQQGRVLRQGFLGGIAKVGQQGEVQIGLAIGQKTHFQRLDQMFDVLRAGQQRRHRHQRAVLRRDAGGKIHPRQWTWRRQQGGQPVHQRRCKLPRGEQGEEADQQQRPDGDAVQPGPRQQPGAEQQRQQRDRAQIKQQWTPAGPSP